MGTVLLLTKALQPSAEVLPGLALLTWLLYAAA